MTHAVIDSPLGPLSAVARDGALAGLYMLDQRHRPAPVAFGERDDSALPELHEQLTAYWDRELQTFDVPLVKQGTDFQQKVWAALRRIPYGQTWSYGRLAVEVGQPTASRAVGMANGRNPVGIVVPCHRVIGSTGSLVGYGGGLERKKFLLALENGIDALV